MESRLSPANTCNSLLTMQKLKMNRTVIGMIVSVSTNARKCVTILHVSKLQKHCLGFVLLHKHFAKQFIWVALETLTWKVTHPNFISIYNDHAMWGILIQFFKLWLWTSTTIQTCHEKCAAFCDSVSGLKKSTPYYTRQNWIWFRYNRV